MSARKRNWQTNKTREKIRDSIKVGQIVKRLEDHLFSEEGKIDDAGNPIPFVKMTQTQIKAAEVLLQRTLPTLSSAEIVEETKAPGMQDAIDALKRMVGPELAELLLQGKEKIESVEAREPETLIHAQPEKAQ